ncbi:MAG: hypothetical protein ACYTHK_08840 [Planctomycetota bacterium]
MLRAFAIFIILTAAFLTVLVWPRSDPNPVPSMEERRRKTQEAHQARIEEAARLREFYARERADARSRIDKLNAELVRKFHECERDPSNKELQGALRALLLEREREVSKYQGYSRMWPEPEMGGS